MESNANGVQFTVNALIEYLNGRVANAPGLLEYLLSQKRIKMFGSNGDTKCILSAASELSPPPTKWRGLCNLVINLSDGNIKVLGAGVPLLFPPTNWIDALLHLDQYDIYEIALGTVLILYFDGSAWKLASKRSIDIRTKQWRELSFEEAFYEVLDRFPNFDLGALDKNKTYSFVLRNSKIHILDSDVLLHVCTRDNKTLEMLDDDIGIPKQMPIQITAEDMLNGLNMPILQQDMKKPILGYILRPRGDGEHMILKSRLYKRIEYYTGTEPNINNIIRFVSYQSEEDLDEFRHMFPSLAPLLDARCENFREIARKLANNHNAVVGLRNLIKRSPLGDAFESKNSEKVIYDIIRTSKNQRIIQRVESLLRE